MILDCTVLGNERHNVPSELFMYMCQSVQQKPQWIKHKNKIGGNSCNGVKTASDSGKRNV